MKTDIQFDNHDSRIKYYELLLERSLDNLPHYPLPDGYRFVFFRPGDEKAWIDIEISAKELSGYEQGVEVWNKYYGGNENMLSERMVFIENEEGEKVATATAYYDIMKRADACIVVRNPPICDGPLLATDITGRDKSGEGWLHWVAVRRNYQGKGLAKPLISHVLAIMHGLGYTHAKIPTQTTTWLACRIYLDFGFRPLFQNAVQSREGWRIVKALTNHPALIEFDAASPAEILEEKSACEW